MRRNNGGYSSFLLIIPFALALAACGGAVSSPPLAPTIGSVPQLQITTNALATASIQQSYQATMSATGGVAPYTWRLASGLLPLGLMLGAVSGDISGTPTETGQFNITVEVTDSSQPSPQSATKAFTLSVAAGQTDQFGGILALPSPGGATGNWRVEKFGDRWLFVTPEGNAFWSLGVFAVAPTGNAISKYGDQDITWGPQQVRRLRSWGFNTILDHANGWVRPTASIDVWPGDHTQPEKMPQVWLINATNESWRNISNYAPQASKELFNSATNSEGVDSTYYTGFQGPTPDPFDPNLEVWFQTFVQTHQVIQTVGNSPWTIGFSTAESDFVFGFGAGASADFATIPPGHNNPHLGYIVLITSPTQTENTTWGVTYADTTVYAKQALKNFLQTRYGTVAALNAAWSSNYSSFDSDGGWGRDNSSGALAQFGLLDENGSSPWVPGDWDNLSGATTAMKQDLDDYLFQHADKLFSVLDGPVRAQFPNLLHLGPNVIGSWMTPPRKQILQAAANYLDAAMTSLVSGDAAEDQGRLDYFIQHFGDKPLATWLGIVANPDSALFNSPNPPTQFPMNTQAERGQKYNEILNALLNATVSSSGTKPFIGVRFWAHVDSTGEQANWGLVSPTDNAYDGQEAIVAPGVDPWGFPTGGEAGDYGDFLTPVTQTNNNIYSNILSIDGMPPPPPPSDTTPPTVLVTSPSSGSTVSGTLTLSASASDNVGVVGVQFKIDGTNIGVEDTTSPYSISWDSTSVSDGSHTITAIARDAAGNQTTSGGVSVTVSNAAPPPPPPPTSGVTLTLQPSQAKQTWIAWRAEVTGPIFGATQNDDVPPAVMTDIVNTLVNDLGLNGFRLVFNQGWMNGLQGIEPTNDNANPFFIDTGVFFPQFAAPFTNGAGTELNDIPRTMNEFVVPVRNAVLSNGETFSLYVSSVGDYNEFQSHWHSNIEEHAEYIEAGVLWLQTNWGFVPDYWAIVNEPNPSEWHVSDPSEIGQVAEAAASRFSSRGWITKIQFPEALQSNDGGGQNMTNSCDHATLPDCPAAVGLVSFHGYDYNSTLMPTDFSGRHFYRDKAATWGVPTAMTEICCMAGWNGSYDHGLQVVRDIYWNMTEANISVWEPLAVMFPCGSPGCPVGTSDLLVLEPGTLDQLYKLPVYYAVRQFGKWIRPGYVRVETNCTNCTNDPGTGLTVKTVAFRRPNGSYTVVVINDQPASVTITLSGFPAGTYQIEGVDPSVCIDVPGGADIRERCISTAYPSQSITNGDDLVLDIPARGVVTFY